MLKITLFLSLLFLTTNGSPTTEVSTGTTKPYVILKLDDLWCKNDVVHPGWEKVIEFLNSQDVKGSIGLIGSSLEKDNPAYFEWIQKRKQEGYEIWNHGFCHCRMEENGTEIREFRGKGREEQWESIFKTQKLAKEKLGITLHTFGAPYNSTDAYTSEVLDRNSDLKIWLYKETKSPTSKFLLNRIPAVNIEYPVHQPDFEQFKMGYEKFKQEPILIIQGHPRSWAEEEERFENFKKIILYLKKEGVSFTTPHEYFLLKSKEKQEATNTKRPTSLSDLLEPHQDDVVALAEQYLEQEPVPITKFSSPRSAGGIHDFYSEGDYWWQNPADPDGPYIRRDGQSNPHNFVEHRQAMRRLNQWVSALVAAYKITKEEKYAAHALKHLRAFFLDKNTLMNPSLLYAQAIKGKVTGRGIGIIDTIHLIEVAKAIEVLAKLGFLKGEDLLGLKDWFDTYAEWLNTHPYGLDEKEHGNNHSTWWAAQVAAFAHLAEREDLMKVAREQFKKMLEAQMAEDGSFPDELSRTKPYNYSLFNLEGYSVLCHIASTEKENLWDYQSKNGSLEQAWSFMLPYLKDKSKWIRRPDIQHFDELPIQTPALLFAGLAYENQDFLTTWKSLDPERKSEEVIRTYPIWQASLWVNNF